MRREYVLLLLNVLWIGIGGGMAETGIDRPEPVKTDDEFL